MTVPELPLAPRVPQQPFPRNPAPPMAATHTISPTLYISRNETLVARPVSYQSMHQFVGSCARSTLHAASRTQQGKAQGRATCQKSKFPIRIFTSKPHHDGREKKKKKTVCKRKRWREKKTSREAEEEKKQLASVNLDNHPCPCGPTQNLRQEKRKWDFLSFTYFHFHPPKHSRIHTYRFLGSSVSQALWEIPCRTWKSFFFSWHAYLGKSKRKTEKKNGNETSTFKGTVSYSKKAEEHRQDETVRVPGYV